MTAPGFDESFTRRRFLTYSGAVISLAALGVRRGVAAAVGLTGRGTLIALIQDDLSLAITRDISVPGTIAVGPSAGVKVLISPPPSLAFRSQADPPIIAGKLALPLEPGGLVLASGNWDGAKMVADQLYVEPAPLPLVRG